MSEAVVRAIVVAYRSRASLPACLESLARAGVELDQSLGRPGTLEVVLADNDSQDGSLEWLHAAWPSVRVLEMGANLGFGTAVNHAAEGAGGTALLLLNPDAVLEAQALPRLYSQLCVRPDLALIAPRLTYPDGRAQLNWGPGAGLCAEALQRLRSRHEGSAFWHEGLARWLRGFCSGWYSAAAVLLRRSAFDEVRGFDPGYFLYYEDVDLCLRLRRQGWQLHLEPSACAKHVRGASWNERSACEYRRSQLRYYALWRPRWERALLRAYLRVKLGQERYAAWCCR